MWSPKSTSTFLLLFVISIADCYKVLVVFSVPSKSHKALGEGFVRALLNDGHEVIYATPYPGSKPEKNLKYVDLSATKEFLNEVNLLEQQKTDISRIREMSFNITRAAIQAPDMQRLLKKEAVDAVVTGWNSCDLDAGIAAVLQVPRLVLGSTSIHAGLEYLIDSVQSPAVVPMMMDLPVPMSFTDRVKNTLVVTLMALFTHFVGHPSLESSYKELFTPIAETRGIELPSFYETVHDISALFINSHPSIGYAQSLPPNAFEIGGYHIDPKIPPLPEDLKTILDNSSNGVIYFSMGSILKSSNMHQKTKNDLLTMFNDLPYTVLWKFEEKIENVPENVVVRAWMPQASILAHPNVKLFISHGGLLSTLEAVHFGVPILAVPVFGDQPSNAARAARKGYALTVPYSPDMGPELKEKLTEMLSSDKYYKKAKEISFIFKSRPVTNEHLITHHLKLAIETKGAHHLRSTSLQYRWYHRLLIDQILVLLLIITTLYYIIRRLCCTSRTHEKNKQKRN